MEYYCRRKYWQEKYSRHWNSSESAITDKNSPKSIIVSVYSTNKVLLKFTYNKIPKSINIDRSGPKIITKDA